MMAKIKQIIHHYENHLIQFEGDENWYFFDINKLNGMSINGKIVKKRTRVWFI